MTSILDLLSNFATIFLGIFLEAVPYLLLGTLASALVESLLQTGDVVRWIPRNRFFQVLAGSLLGLFFPVCECGVVPLTRRLMWKGLPTGAAMAFLLAAPVLNPVVIASTASAFGAGPVLWGRLVGTLVIAVATGLIFSFLPGTEAVLRPVIEKSDPQAVLPATRRGRLRRLTIIAADEFFEMGRFLVIGSALAALMQTLVPQQALLAFGRGPVWSVLVLIALAVLLSVCSTVDAFIALAFAGVFSTGSVLGFLIYGPMVDIKSTLMFLQVFKRRTVAYLVLLPLAMTILVGIFWNLVIGN